MIGTFDALSPIRTLGRRVGAFAGRHALALRTAIAVIASMLFLVVASEAFFTRAASRELVQQDARAYQADGIALETAYREGEDAADAIDDVLDLVDSMEDRLGVISATLLDSEGKVVTVPRDSKLTSDRDTEAGPRDARDLADVETRRDGQAYEFRVPIFLADRPFVLEVDEDGQVLDSRVAALRTEALVFSGISLLIGMVLFYVLAGRTLARRHRTVVIRATRDPLTDLGNHRSFQEELATAVAVATRRRESLAVALVDIDDFKFMNDRHGHRRGDEVLAEVARLLDRGRGEDRAFRIGGDEFALLMPSLDSTSARLALERRLAPTELNPTAVSVSVGVAVLSPGADTDPSVLWEQADAALYEGKRAGGGAVVVFDDVEELLAIVTPAKILALRALLEEPRLEIAFQPIWDLQAGRVLGVEALARPWDGYGFDGPSEMFSVAEKIGRAHELDAICRSAALARADDLPDGVLLFLNVNPQSLTHGNLGGDRLLRAVASAGLLPAQVVLEITELSDARLNQVVADANRLRSLGFGLALDDVGAGNAGLEMLRDLPVDYVKVDQSIITAAAEDTQAQAVLIAIIAYARRAGAFVIAEGIESDAILHFVRNAAELHVMSEPPIRGGQGYLLGRPSRDLSDLEQLGRQRLQPERPPQLVGT
jgi:diguanylate cyclase (GGDEF)-like protein